MEQLQGFYKTKALFQFPPFKIPGFVFVLQVITAKNLMLRCKVRRTNLFTLVDFFTTPNFIALWQQNKHFIIEIERGELERRQKQKSQRRKISRFFTALPEELEFK